MLRQAMAVLAIAMLCAAAGAQEKPTIYTDKNAPIEARIDDLLSRLTLEEKLALLGGTGFTTTPIPRLGIPPLGMADAPHGVRYGKATTFPAGIAMASTWDPDLIKRVGAAIGSELSGKGQDVILGPCVNIHRSPLGGRNMESFSEDPYLAARMTVAYINGVQSQGVAACVKHFACNNEEADRNTVSVQIDDRALHEIYFPAFRAAVQEAHVWTLMCSYNRVNGIYASANHDLMTSILKTDWGFDGLAMSDWGAVHEAVAVAKSGLDLEMPGGYWLNAKNLIPAIKSGEIAPSVIDEMVRRILRAIIRTGLLDGPKERDPSAVNCEAHQKLAREVAGEAIVLLKNSSGILPLDAKAIKSIAVIGPNADMSLCGGAGSAAVVPVYYVTALDGIRRKVGAGVTVRYALGDVLGSERPLLIPSDALTPPNAAPGEHGLRGEYFANQTLQGDPTFVRVDKQIGFDWVLASPGEGLPVDQFSVRWTGALAVPETDTYTLGTIADDGTRLYLDGKLIIDDWKDHGKEVRTASVRLEKGKSYDIRLEYYENAGDASVTLGWIAASAQNNRIAEAAAVARECDVAIVMAGLSVDYEGEGFDRASMKLPGKQDELIRAVAAANPKTIVVLTCGTPSLMDAWIDRVPGLLQAWYSGQEGGNAIADVLFGDVNPSGKLPDTFAHKREDYPDYGNFPGKDDVVKYAEGIFVGYRHFDKSKIDPLFPFGYGLSYTTFAYSDLTVTQLGDYVTVKLAVKNTGKRAGTEIVQVYVGPPQGTVPRPVRELKGFARVTLSPGESKPVTITLNRDAFAYYDTDSSAWKVPAGEYAIEVGASSRDERFTVRMAVPVP